MLSHIIPAKEPKLQKNFTHINISRLPQLFYTPPASKGGTTESVIFLRNDTNYYEGAYYNVRTLSSSLAECRQLLKRSVTELSYSSFHGPLPGLHSSQAIVRGIGKILKRFSIPNRLCEYQQAIGRQLIGR